MRILKVERVDLPKNANIKKLYISKTLRKITAKLLNRNKRRFYYSLTLIIYYHLLFAIILLFINIFIS